MEIFRVTMNYALGYAFNIHDMFANFDTSKLDLETKKCEELIGNRHKEVIAKKVFKYAVKLVIDDVINNSARFELPTGGKKSFIAMKKFSGDDFKNARRHGKWKDIDFLNSNFSAYSMIFNYQNHGIFKEKLVITANKIKNVKIKKTTSVAQIVYEYSDN